MIEYEEFMTLYSFPLQARTFNSVIKALSPSYVQLLKHAIAKYDQTFIGWSLSS